MASLIHLMLKASIVLTVFALGLSTRPQDVAYIIHRPELLLKSLLSINIVMPLFVVSMIAHHPVGTCRADRIDLAVSFPHSADASEKGAEGGG